MGHGAVEQYPPEVPTVEQQFGLFSGFAIVNADKAKS